MLTQIQKRMPDEWSSLLFPDYVPIVQKNVAWLQSFLLFMCKRTFNERTATPYNHLQFPTDIVLLVVLWRLRYKLSLRDLTEMFLERGFEFTHETVRDWEERFAPLVTKLILRTD